MPTNSRNLYLYAYFHTRPYASRRVYSRSKNSFLYDTLAPISYFTPAASSFFKSCTLSLEATSTASFVVTTTRSFTPSAANFTPYATATEPSQSRNVTSPNTAFPDPICLRCRPAEVQVPTSSHPKSPDVTSTFLAFSITA